MRLRLVLCALSALVALSCAVSLDHSPAFAPNSLLDDPLRQFRGHTESEALNRIDAVLSDYSDQKIAPELVHAHPNAGLQNSQPSKPTAAQAPKRPKFAKNNCCAKHNTKDQCSGLGGERDDAQIRKLDRRCLGAIGKGCKGDPEAPASAIDEDHFVEVAVSPGSIAHANCCLRYPFGQMCGRGVTDRAQDEKPWDPECACSGEWVKAQANLRDGRFWRTNMTEFSDMRIRKARPVFVDIYGWRRVRPESETHGTRSLRAPPGTKLDCPIGFYNCRPGRYPDGVRAGDSVFCRSGLFSRVVAPKTSNSTAYGVCSKTSPEDRIRKLSRRKLVKTNVQGVVKKPKVVKEKDHGPFAAFRKRNVASRKKKLRDEVEEVEASFNPAKVPKTRPAQKRWLELLQEINDYRITFARRIAVRADVKRARQLSKHDRAVLTRLELGRALYTASPNKGLWPRALRLYYEGSRAKDTRIWRLLLARKLYKATVDSLKWPVAVRRYFEEWDKVERQQLSDELNAKAKAKNKSKAPKPRLAAPFRLAEPLTVSEKAEEQRERAALSKLKGADAVKEYVSWLQRVPSPAAAPTLAPSKATNLASSSPALPALTASKAPVAPASAVQSVQAAVQPTPNKAAELKPTAAQIAKPASEPQSAQTQPAKTQQPKPAQATPAKTQQPNPDAALDKLVRISKKERARAAVEMVKLFAADDTDRLLDEEMEQVASTVTKQ